MSTTIESTIMSAEAVLTHHLEAFLNNDIKEIMKDYSDDSEMWVENGLIKGKEAISSFFTYVFTLLPKATSRFDLKQKIVNGDKAYIVWEAESPSVSIPFGTDSFNIKNGCILWHTAAAQIIQK